MSTYTHTDARVGQYRAESSPDGCLARVIHEPTGRCVVRFTGETAHADAVRYAYDTYTRERFENRSDERPEVVYRDAVRTLRP